jgi:ABC-2 type transport system permease protein
MNKKNLIKYWQIFWQFRRIQLMRMMEYRGDFIFWTIVSVFWTGFNFLFFGIIVTMSGTIAGWNEYQLYLLLATFTIIDAFTWSFFYQNMSEYTESVFSGKLDLLLTKPLDAQFLLSFQTNSYNNIFRFFIGIAALVWALNQLNITPSWWQILLYIVLVITSLILIYSLWFIIATCSFWVERLRNINEIIPALRRVFQVPRTVYTGASSIIFTVLLPLGLVSSLPSEVLLGEFAVNWIAYFIFVSLVFFWLARSFFHYSVRRYSSVGS